MCFTIASTVQKAKAYIHEYLNSNEGVQMHIDFTNMTDMHLVSGFSHPKLPIVKHKSIDLAEWGLIPSFAVTVQMASDIRNKTLNARNDTIYKRVSFKNSIVNQRCLLVIDGFFEWRHVGSKKYPYYVYPKDETVFHLGCIYNSWTDPTTGEEKDTFSIITTEANPLMEIIHNSKKRMPLIIDKKDIALWIDPTTSKEVVEKLMSPFDEAKMSAHTISNEANNVRNQRNFPEIKQKVKYGELESF